MQHIQIAIDGPSGAGKSTISKAIAARLGIVYVDTGALYRTVGYYARSQGISLPAIAAVVDKLSDIHVEVRYVDGVQNVFLNGENLGDRIRGQGLLDTRRLPGRGPQPPAGDRPPREAVGCQPRQISYSVST